MVMQSRAGALAQLCYQEPTALPSYHVAILLQGCSDGGCRTWHHIFCLHQLRLFWKTDNSVGILNCKGILVQGI